MQEDKTEEETEVASYHSGPSAWNNLYIDKYLYSLLFWDFTVPCYTAVFLYIILIILYHYVFYTSWCVRLYEQISKYYPCNNAPMHQYIILLMNLYTNEKAQMH